MPGKAVLIGPFVEGAAEGVGVGVIVEAAVGEGCAVGLGGRVAALGFARVNSGSMSPVRQTTPPVPMSRAAVRRPVTRRPKRGWRRCLPGRGLGRGGASRSRLTDPPLESGARSCSGRILGERAGSTL